MPNHTRKALMVKELSELLIRGQTSTILIELEIGPELVEMLTGGWILDFDTRAINSELDNKMTKRPNSRANQISNGGGRVNRIQQLELSCLDLDLGL